MNSCVACGGSKTTGAFVLAGGAYATCRECGLASLDPLPPDTSALYSEGYFKGGVAGGYADYDADQNLHDANARARLALIRRHRTTLPSAVLDVGCAVGTFLVAARALGARVAGVDVSPWARHEALRRHQLAVEPSVGDTSAKHPEAFDLVTFFQSLEHMPYPDKELAAANTCLNADGLLVIETWDAGSPIARLMGRAWQQMNPPTVLHLMSRRSISALLERAGFELLAVERTSKLVSTGLVLHILADKSPRLLGWLRAVGRVPWMGRLTLRYSLGDLITVVARKSGVSVSGAEATSRPRERSMNRRSENRPPVGASSRSPAAPNDL